ncbi:MAG: 2-C-methyl-D-erythritol 4-phosphate cytidylyltransferase [Oscillospiraceae bacterium]|nr:2-C-methyl-D-erythritol 4-phosphate cytidylyltransferase [Oscillospiraceae bacterium]
MIFIYISAVILCAGNSSRMGAGINKNLLPLGGGSVIERSVKAFEDCPLIDEIIVVAKAPDETRAVLEKSGFAKLKAIIEGGKTRTESSKKGVLAASGQAAHVLIHDGARPLVSVNLIMKVAEAAMIYGAAAPATKLKETVKTAFGDFAGETLDRSALRAIQTPQGFLKSLYLEGAEKSAAGADLLDDCVLVEALGHKVRLIEGEYANIKITTPEDLALAEFFLQYKAER